MTHTFACGRCWTRAWLRACLWQVWSAAATAQTWICWRGGTASCTGLLA